MILLVCYAVISILLVCGSIIEIHLLMSMNLNYYKYGFSMKAGEILVANSTDQIIANISRVIKRGDTSLAFRNLGDMYLIRSSWKGKTILGSIPFIRLNIKIANKGAAESQINYSIKPVLLPYVTLIYFILSLMVIMLHDLNWSFPYVMILPILVAIFIAGWVYFPYKQIMSIFSILIAAANLGIDKPKYKY